MTEVSLPNEMTQLRDEIIEHLESAVESFKKVDLTLRIPTRQPEEVNPVTPDTINDVVLTLILNDSCIVERLESEVANSTDEFYRQLNSEVKSITAYIPEHVKIKHLIKTVLLVDMYAYFVETGAIPAGLVDTLLKDADWTYATKKWNKLRKTFNDQWHEHTTQPNPMAYTQKETAAMFTFETRTFINNNEGKTYQDDHLFSLITEAQDEIKRLEGIHEDNRPAKVTKRIEEIQAYIAEVKKFVDNR